MLRHILSGALLALVLAITALPAAAADDMWMTNVEKALKKAAKEKKDILWDFTGSDWCGWCIRLDDEVFSKDAFTQEAPKHFVFLKLDFPKRTQLAPELKKQNDTWMKKFGVQGFPSIFLTDAKARPYAQTGYQQGGPEVYLAHLMKLRSIREKRDKAFEEAKTAEGVEKARLLDRAIGKMQPGLIASVYKKTAEEIMTLDADNEAGLKIKYASMLANQRVMALLQERKLDEALKKITTLLEEFKEEAQLRQDLLYIKSRIAYVKRDIEGAIAALEESLAAAPESEKSGQIERTIAGLKRMLEQQKNKE